MKPEVYEAILKKTRGLFEVSSGMVDLKATPSHDESIVYIYDKSTGKEATAGSPDKILAHLADIETSIIDLSYMGYKGLKNNT